MQSLHSWIWDNLYMLNCTSDLNWRVKTHLYNNTTEDEKETTSLRDLEVSIAKLYALVNTQVAATREMDTINQN